MVTRHLGVRAAAATALIAVAALLTGCDWYNGDNHGSGDQDSHAAIRRAQPSPIVTGRVDGLGEATFELLNGADAVRIQAGDLGEDLYRVSTPDNAKVAPSVHVDDGTVFAGLRGTGQPGPAIVDVVLSDAVRWQVHLGAGARDETVDLTEGQVEAVEFSAGTNRAEVSLPAAKHTVRVLMSGGASQFLVHLTGDAPVRVQAGGGAGTVTVDGAGRSGVSGGTVITPAAWTTATDRYDVDATAGVSNLTVDRR